MPRAPWMVSLHGGHSGEFCEHARGTLRQVLESAVRAGYRTFGVSEHAPRLEARYLYESELRRGYNLDRLMSEFQCYAALSADLVDEFQDRLVVLRGFEAEVVPSRDYPRWTSKWRRDYGFDYVVGSVHFLDGCSIDGPLDDFKEAVRRQGGLEGFAVSYYRAVSEMVARLRPEVVGHLDLIRRHVPQSPCYETERVREAASQALAVVKEAEAILDLNTAGYRKGLGGPYPAPWLVRLASRMGIGFCFGDDSHGPDEVGAGLPEARRYLLDNGVERIEYWTRRDGLMVREHASLLEEESKAVQAD